MDDNIPVHVSSERATALRWDDIEFMGYVGGPVSEVRRIVTDEKISEALHDMPEQWLRSRVRGWMELAESPDLDFWIGTYTEDGKWIFCSSRQDTFAPLEHRIDYARRICRHLNRICAHGGVWLAGWIRGGHEFYLLWKDADGDIQIPIECDRPFTLLQGWTLYNWEQQAENAYKVWSEFRKNMEFGRGQNRKLAQGEETSATHLQEAPPIGI